MERKTLGVLASSYSPAVLVSAGRTIYVSGTVALDAQGNVVHPGDVEAQARFVFQQIAELLQAGGASLHDVVKINTFITDMKRYGEFSKVRKEVFGEGPFPASAAVEVSALVKDGLLIEIEAIAVF